MKVSVTLNGNSFEVDEISELTPAFTDVFRAWINAQQEGSAAEKLEEATTHLQNANTVAEQVVKDHTRGEGHA